MVLMVSSQLNGGQRRMTITGTPLVTPTARRTTSPGCCCTTTSGHCVLDAASADPAEAASKFDELNVALRRALRL
jgi:hypothetical protein